MNPSWHIFLGVLFSLFLFFLFPETGVNNILLFLASTVLIDVDHYLFYIYTKKEFSLKRAYAYFIRNKQKLKEFGRGSSYGLPSILCIFHGFEILVIVFALSFIFKPMYFVFVGCSFHLFLDLIEQAVYSNRLQKISVVNDFLNYKK